MKKKKEGKPEQKQKFNNFQITWNDCNSDGDVEEEEESAHMAFTAIDDDEVTTCNSQPVSDDEFDDDIESFIERLHDSLKESYVRNKELKQKISFLLQDNVNLFQRNKKLKAENNYFKKNETVLHFEFDRKIKLCDLFKKEQSDLKRRMNCLNELLQYKKQNCFQRNDSKPHFGIHEKMLNSSANEFTIYKRRQVRFVKPEFADYVYFLLSNWLHEE